MIKPEKEREVEDLVSEYIKCKNDFVYFCRKYIFIELPGGDVLLDPYRKQKELIDLILEKHFVLVLKSRQIGVSTIIQAYSTWLAMFHDNVVIGIISKDGKEATDFARGIRGMVEKLPDWLKPTGGVMGRGFAKRSEQSFILTNGSKIFASPVAPNAPEKTLRGKAITFLVIDEAAFIKFVETAWTAMVPALSTNQMMAKNNNIPYGTVLLSTPNKTLGPGKWFFDRYSSTISGDTIFTPYKIHWREIPQLVEDKSWYQNQCEFFNNDQKKIQQELELKFLSASGSFFEASTVEKLQEVDAEPIEKIKVFNGEVWKFQEPILGKYYIIGVDTAPEHGEDKSAITVWDYQTLEQVWEYQGKCRVDDFVKVVKLACAQYSGLLVIESNSYGNQVIEAIDRSEYSLMMYKETRGKDTIVPGLSTNAKTRPLMIEALYTYISEFPESVKSKRLVLELISLTTKISGQTERVQADVGCHDDLAMATATAFYVRKWDPPMIIDGARTFQTQELSRIVDMNKDHLDVSNPEIMKYVKENISEMGGFVDILSMYNKGGGLDELRKRNPSAK